MTPQTIVDTARGWIGTPYLHQASCKGSGADCLGLVRGVWRDIRGEEPEVVPAYTADWSEPQQKERLLEGAQKHLIQKPIREMAIGNVLLFRMRQNAVAKHLGIVAQIGAEPTFIHAYSGHHVVESALSEPWRRRVAACFSFPDFGG